MFAVSLARRLRWVLILDSAVFRRITLSRVFYNYAFRGYWLPREGDLDCFFGPYRVSFFCWRFVRFWTYCTYRVWRNYAGLRRRKCFAVALDYAFRGGEDGNVKAAAVKIGLSSTAHRHVGSTTAHVSHAPR